jgi:hypothetical protein
MLKTRVCAKGPLEASGVMLETSAMRTVHRNAALDFTKGALVLFMVLYHWLNTFIGAHDYIYRYLRFLPPSFIFITGFLISNIYLVKYNITDTTLTTRLLYRGVKILGLFTVLNLTVNALFMHFPTTLGSAIAVYVTGNIVFSGVGKVAVFYILVPISYLLISSAGLLLGWSRYKYTFLVAYLVVTCLIVVLQFNGLESGNLELLAVGFLGASLGYISIEKLELIALHSGKLCIAYLCYIIAVTVWSPGYFMQVIGVCLTLLVLYCLGVNTSGSSAAQRYINQLGKYSLFGYVIQVVFLQILYRGLRRSHLGTFSLCVSLVAALVLTVGAVAAVDRARDKSTVLNMLYKAVFA